MWLVPREIVGSTDWLATLSAQRRTLDAIDLRVLWCTSDIAFRSDVLDTWTSEFPTPRSNASKASATSLRSRQPTDSSPRSKPDVEPGALAGHQGEMSQLFAKHTAVYLVNQLAMTVALMVWIARTV